MKKYDSIVPFFILFSSYRKVPFIKFINKRRRKRGEYEGRKPFGGGQFDEG
jgi:hypothetical protein